MRYVKYFAQMRNFQRGFVLSLCMGPLLLLLQYVLQALYIDADAYWHHSSLCTKHTAVIQLQSGFSKAVVRLRFGPNVPLLAYIPRIKYYGSWPSCQAVVRITAQCLGRFSVILA